MRIKFFPNSWDETRIQEEVIHALENNRGIIDDTKPSKGIWGYNKDGTFKIQIQYDPNNGKISSFFPIFDNNLK